MYFVLSSDLIYTTWSCAFSRFLPSTRLVNRSRQVNTSFQSMSDHRVFDQSQRYISTEREIANYQCNFDINTFPSWFSFMISVFRVTAIMVIGFSITLLPYSIILLLFVAGTLSCGETTSKIFVFATFFRFVTFFRLTKNLFLACLRALSTLLSTTYPRRISRAKFYRWLELKIKLARRGYQKLGWNSLFNLIFK